MQEPHNFSLSYFYSIEPIGVGTALCESLLSYVTRLAKEHCVPVEVLMESQIAPMLNKTYGGGNLHRIYEATPAFNGTGLMSRDLVNSIEQLTQRQNLSFLTLLAWAEILPTRGLLCQQRRWCPLCYEDWHSNKQTVYDPLLWSIRCINICSKHLQPLVQTCPHCHCSNLALAWKSRSGYCYKCLKWLGANSLSESSSTLKNELAQEAWKAKAVGELISAAPFLHTPFAKQRISQSLKAYVDITTSGNIAEFSRQIQEPRNTVWLWCEGKNQPQLETLLKLCYCLNVSLLRFLTELSIENQTVLLQVGAAKGVASRAEPKPIDLVKLEQELEDALFNHECPPPSMEEVARRLKLDRRTILKHFPEMCHAISAKYILYKQAAKLSAIEQCCQEIKQAVNKLYNQGLYPSESRVSELLTKPGFLRYKEVREVIAQTKADLGISSFI